MYRVGVTGPSDYTGGYGAQGDFHADLKFSQSMPLNQRVQLLTDLANKKAAEGRFIEFSNQGVAGLRFDPGASLENRTKLYQQVVGAHAPRSGFDSIDYYSVSNKDQNRFAQSAEGANIYLPNVSGGKIGTGSGGGYGNYAYVTGPDGNVLIKTGHADTRFAGDDLPKLDSGVIARKPVGVEEVVDRQEPVPKVDPKPVEEPQPTKDFFRDEMKKVMLSRLFEEDGPKARVSTAREEIARDLKNRPFRMAQQVDLSPVIAEFKIPKIRSSSEAFKTIDAVAGI